MTEKIDFQSVHRTTLLHIDTFLDTRLPGGKREGHEYVVRNPTRPDNSPGSFKINLTTGAWSDFATGDTGGDLVSLYAYISDMSQLEAAKALLAEYGGSAAAKPERTKQARKRITWTPILPLPDDTPAPPVAHHHYGRYSAHWDYFDSGGHVLGRICRFDRGDGRKEVLPLTYCEGSNGARGWQFRSWDPPRPLYGLDWLALTPESTVLVVEGEKCAFRAASVLDDGYVPISWPGGGKAVKKTDWTPLQGRKVVIWPDNDEPGISAAKTIAKLLSGIAAEVRMLPVPGAVMPKGWDIAEAIEDGWDAARIVAYLATAKPVTPDAGPTDDVSACGGEAGDAPDYTDQPSAAPALAPGEYHHTDMGAAQFLVDRYGNELRYNARPFRSWFWYDSIRWREDLSNRVYDYVDRVVRDILVEASKLDTDHRKPLEKWAYRLEGMSRQKAMVAKAETLQAISVAAEEFNRNNWLFNCRNVTIDLESGEPVARPHNAGDYITMLSPVTYDPDALCPRWLQFLMRIFNNDEEMIAFMQRAIGYSLTADVSEQVLFFCYGMGANGKSVFFETIRALMGDYGGKAPTEMLMQQQFNQIPTDVADLRGKRFVVASEVEDGKRWAESRLKDLTGGDTIKARRMREDFFEFPQTHKLWVFGNHKPVLRGTDEGIKRRIRIIPFEVTIPQEERIPLGQILATFRAELPGILNWALAGYVRWREIGLGTPQVVEAATTEYFDDNDILQQFIDECCIVNNAVSVIGKRLWEAYHGWCDSNGIRSLSSKGFYRVLLERGFTKRLGHGNKTTIDGIDLEQTSAPQ